jgi:hypothetical protein
MLFDNMASLMRQNASNDIIIIGKVIALDKTGVCVTG